MYTLMYKLDDLHPSLGKRAITFWAVPSSPKKVILVFPPKVINMKLEILRNSVTIINC